MYPDRAYTPPMPASSDLFIEERDNGQSRVLIVTGDLDVATAPTLAKRLDELQANQIEVRLDLSNVHFIDSTGIRVLVTTAYHARDDVRWKFAVEDSLDSAVRHTLRMTNVEEFILGEHHTRAG